MAHHKSALKRVRQTIKRTAQNRSLRSDLRTVIKKFRLILESGNIEKVREAYSGCLLYTSPSPRDATLSRMPSSA